MLYLIDNVRRRTAAEFFSDAHAHHLAAKGAVIGTSPRGNEITPYHCLGEFHGIDGFIGAQLVIGIVGKGEAVWIVHCITFPIYIEPPIMVFPAFICWFAFAYPLKEFKELLFRLSEQNGVVLIFRIVHEKIMLKIVSLTDTHHEWRTVVSLQRDHEPLRHCNIKTRGRNHDQV